MEPESAFIEACELEFRRLADLTTEELEVAQRRLRRLSRELVELDRRVLALTGRAALFQQAAPERRQRLGLEYERLRALPEVREVQMDGSTLWLLTTPIVLEHGGIRRLLGSYRLELELAGEVRVVNLANPGTKPMWDHPHVQMGLPCLGNLRPGVLKLIAEFEVALAARVVLDFLRTYNPETAYGPIELWPEAR